MSNIYIQEPPTEGKVCLETTAGDIDIELWSREAPKACRNFVQLCMEGYYDGVIFHRLVKGFIVQGGDPTGTGTGGNSIWGKTFKDEFHSRLRFVRRGLVAMANAGKDDNGSQFFFTLGATPELQNKHTIFAKIGGNTIYNMLKLEDGMTDEDEKPLYPHKIVRTKILSNPFNDIVPRESIKKIKDDKKEKNKSKAAATKNYKLLSFGEEAEEDEEEVDEVNKKFSGKGKSSHDLAKDPKLSSQPAIEGSLSSSKKKKRKSKDSDSSLSDDQSKSNDSESDDERKEKSKGGDSDDDESTKRKETDVQTIRDKLKRKDDSKSKDSRKSSKETKGDVSKSSKKDSKSKEDSDEEYYLGKDEKMEQKRKVEELRKEYRDLRKSMRKEEIVKQKEEASVSKEAEAKAAKLAADNTVIKGYLDEQEKYKSVKKKAPKKGEDREAMTLALLAKFKSKIETAKETFGDETSEQSGSGLSTKRKNDLEDGEDNEEDEKSDDISWLARKLHYDKSDEVLAKDANTKSDDWFDIYDPRNALTKRRREKGKQDSKEKKRARINN